MIDIMAYFEYQLRWEHDERWGLVVHPSGVRTLAFRWKRGR